MFEKLFRMQDKDKGRVQKKSTELPDEVAPAETVISHRDGTNVYTGNVDQAVTEADELSLEEEDTGVNPYDNQKAA